MEVHEHCRHWVDKKWDRCGAKAIVIVWGRLSEPEEFGPKCIDHLPEWVDMSRPDQYAVFDLRGLHR